MIGCSWFLLAALSPFLQGTGPGDANSRQPLRAGFLLLDGVYNSELMAPFDIFHHVRFHAKPGIDVFTVGRTKDVVKTFEGLRILPDHDLDSAPPIDILVVPSAEHNMGSDLEDSRLIGWLAVRGKRARYVLSVCDGAFLLAQAGLLEGHSCTTFPDDIPAFKKRYPKLAVVEQVSFVAHGKAVTGAGGARSYDPAMFLVEKLFGKKVARAVGRGMVIDWNLEKVRHVVAAGVAKRGAPPRSWLPGQRVDGDVTIEDATGKRIRLQDIARQQSSKGIVLCLIAGAEGGDTRKRGGFWCEDTFNDMPLLRHLRLVYEPKGVRFIAVCCPPVYHEAEYAYEPGAFLTLPDDDPRYESDRRRFVSRTLALREHQALPFDEVYFDPRFRLLANPSRGEADRGLGERPAWQGKFKWHRDTQTYGTPTLWLLKPDLTVFGQPFFMNVYESPGRKLRYTVRDVGSRLDRLVGQ